MPEELSPIQGELLLTMAREAIAQKLSIDWPDSGSNLSNPVERDFLTRKQGVFVTLHKKGQLRGCIGTIEPVSDIGTAVCDNARFAAFRDSRFDSLQHQEFDAIDIEVSVLSVPEPLDYDSPEQLVTRLTPYRDGVVLKKGFRKATFLPQVWEQLPSVSQFLSQLCLKAGLAGNAWETQVLEVSVYRVQSFGELPS